MAISQALSHGDREERQREEHGRADVLLTPHVASASARFDPVRKRRVGQEIALVLSGRWPRSCVNPSVLEKSELMRWQPYSMERGPGA